MHPGTMLTDAVRQWPTPPSARDFKDSPGMSPMRPDGSRMRDDQLPRAAQLWSWPTPAARDYKGENAAVHLERSTGAKHLDQLPNFVAHLWATPRAEDSEQCGNYPGANDSLTGQTRLWPTPAATPYGSSQNGCNGIGGEHERPSANTPGLERMSHSFLPLLATSTSGGLSSPAGQTSLPPSPTRAKLNPRFVEYLMGLPIGWTALNASIDCAPAATRWSRWQQRMRSSLWRLVRD